MNPVELFENEFEEFLGVNYAVAVCNGTAALHSALLALDVQPGDKVITTPFTFVATANTILMCGATPVFADVDPETYCIDPKEVEKQLDIHPDAVGVVAVHLFGRTVDMVALRYAMGERFIVEDASQALGARIDCLDANAGSLGDAGTFSFYASKNLSSYEGGMIVTPYTSVHEKLLKIRNHGLDENNRMVTMGYNYKMPWNCAFHGWQTLLLHKPGILAELRRYDIGGEFYPEVVYNQPYYKQLGITGDCPIAEELARKVREGKL